MKSTLFQQTENEQEEHKGFTLQNNHMLLVNLNGEISAKQGSMAAYQGEVDFSYEGGGIGKTLKEMVSGEDLPLMKCKGQGDVFLADNGSEIYVVEMENEQLTVNNTNILAFESGLEYDVSRTKSGIMGFMAGGLFNITLTGTGMAALTSHGRPTVLRVDQPTYVDADCVIAWSTSLNVDIKSTMKAGMLIGRSSGEAFQMGFTGEGFVVVQPGEGLEALIASATASGGGGSSESGGLGEIGEMFG